MLLSFYEKKFKTKPDKYMIGTINDMLSTKNFNFEEIIHLVGECGCTFCPAVFNGKRCNANYLQQQIFVLDFDGGITFNEVQSISEMYHLPILFAYKTFSYTPEHEKFRVVFYTDTPIKDSNTARIIIRVLMQIFDNTSDSTCKDVARMFFRGVRDYYTKVLTINLLI